MQALEGRVTEIQVHSPHGDYPVLVGRGLLPELGRLAAGRGLGRRVLVATDSVVGPLYGEQVISSLEAAGFQATLATMHAGEQHKVWDSVSLFVEAALDAGLDRSSWVLALGGGVVGDTAGFAASVYMRGVSFVQVPTTLLAMADSSIGGKVGVDHPRGKNLLGAFKHPALVVADLDTLATLPPIQVACGMAEIIKAGIIGDPALFNYLEATDPAELDYAKALAAAILVKRGIVQRDPEERGERALLNLGHTFGHAFEKRTGYSRLHGVAVAQGMAVAFRLAVKLVMCDPALEVRVGQVLSKWGLPLRWGAPELLDAAEVERIYEIMLGDKKRLDGRTRLALPEVVGRVSIVEGVTEDAIKSALVELQ
ncbi:MAG: 3-dehydroquinate synthase [Chloroflexota bacterium]|nr:3-dehydroquinate synthase [Chloroflexota bacterium]